MEFNKNSLTVSSPRRQLSAVGLPSELRMPLDYANNLGPTLVDGFSSVQLFLPRTPCPPRCNCDDCYLIFLLLAGPL